VIAAAGDIACDPASRNFRRGHGTATACHMGATARLLRRLDPQVVLTLGDNQYENGTLAKFHRSYDRSWGRLRGRTRPTSTTSAPPPAAAPGATTASTWAAGT
jgi:hypothetical protein